MLEIEEFDWLAKRGRVEPFSREPHSLWAAMKFGIKESRHDRCLRFLQSLNSTCIDCTMCELGRKEARNDYESRDPHVFSNLNPKRFVLVGQGPGWQEVKQGEPFVGASGRNLEIELHKNGLSKNDFYITNVIRCYIHDNGRPNNDHLASCKPYLDMEINLIKPYLVITLGAVAFGVFCPTLVFSDSVSKLHQSSVYDVKVFAAYHPSPLNMTDVSRRNEFANQMRIISAVVKRKSKQADQNCTPLTE